MLKINYLNFLDIFLDITKNFIKNLVASPGIEPGTQGFSVPCSTD